MAVGKRKAIKRGSWVRTLTGGSRMRVLMVDAERGLYCRWTEPTGTRMTGWFAKSAVELCP